MKKCVTKGKIIGNYKEKIVDEKINANIDEKCFSLFTPLKTQMVLEVTYSYTKVGS